MKWLEKFFIIAFCFHPLSAQITQNGLYGTFGRVAHAGTIGAGKLGLNLNSTLQIGDLAFDYIEESKDEYVFTQMVGLTYAITNYIELASAIPFYYDIPGRVKSTGSEIKPGKKSGQGDTQILLKVIYPPYPHQEVFRVAFLAGLSAPTGAKDKGYFKRRFFYEDHNYTTESVDIITLVLSTIDFGNINKNAPLRLSFNAGELFNGKRGIMDMYQAGISLEYYPTPYVTILTEVSGETPAGNDISPDQSPLRLSGGFQFSPVPEKFSFSFGIDWALSDTIHTVRHKNNSYASAIMPPLAIHFAMSFLGTLVPQDKDKDGLTENTDRCPQEPEDKDNFEDEDGCPEPDNDQDGLPDNLDKCPTQAEDKDNFEDSDGCPDDDDDNDGFLDREEKCPRLAEDFDGFEDQDGCPELDNDKDGIPDDKDKCPKEPEDGDGFEDADGCPDLDNDRDGLPDNTDQCPNQAETKNNYKDTDGCPDEKTALIPMGRTILTSVKFDRQNVLTYSSYTDLDKLITGLKEDEATLLEIRGFTDSYGAALENKKISQKRAEIVMDYLVKKGIAPHRLKAVGHGEDNPIANNRTAAGREQNRRIEIYRVK